MAVFKNSNFSPNLSEVDLNKQNVFTSQVNTSGEPIKAYKLTIYSKDGSDIIYDGPIIPLTEKKGYYAPVKNKGQLEIPGISSNMINQVPFGTTYYTNTSLTTVGGTTNGIYNYTYVNNTYSTITVENVTKYIKTPSYHGNSLNNSKDYQWNVRTYNVLPNSTTQPNTIVCKGNVAGSTKYVTWVKLTDHGETGANKDVADNIVYDRYIEYEVDSANELIIGAHEDDDKKKPEGISAQNPYISRKKIDWVTKELGTDKDYIKIETTEKFDYDYIDGTPFTIYKCSSDHTVNSAFADPNTNINVSNYIVIYNNVTDAKSAFDAGDTPDDITIEPAFRKKKITGYSSDTGEIRVYDPWITAPSNGQAYRIFEQDITTKEYNELFSTDISYKAKVGSDYYKLIAPTGTKYYSQIVSATTSNPIYYYKEASDSTVSNKKLNTTAAGTLTANTNCYLDGNKWTQGETTDLICSKVIVSPLTVAVGKSVYDMSVPSGVKYYANTTLSGRGRYLWSTTNCTYVSDSASSIVVDGTTYYVATPKTLGTIAASDTINNVTKVNNTYSTVTFTRSGTQHTCYVKTSDVSLEDSASCYVIMTPDGQLASDTAYNFENTTYSKIKVGTKYYQIHTVKGDKVPKEGEYIASNVSGNGGIIVINNESCQIAFNDLICYIGEAILNNPYEAQVIGGRPITNNNFVSINNRWKTTSPAVKRLFIQPNVNIKTDETNPNEIIFNNGCRLNIVKQTRLNTQNNKIVDITFNKLDDSQWMLEGNTLSLEGSTTPPMEGEYIIPQSDYEVYTNFMDSTPNSIFYARTTPTMTINCRNYYLSELAKEEFRTELYGFNNKYYAPKGTHWYKTQDLAEPTVNSTINVFKNTTYYSNSSLTTVVGSLNSNTTGTYKNSNYSEIIIDGTTYFIKTPTNNTNKNLPCYSNGSSDWDPTSKSPARINIDGVVVYIPNWAVRENPILYQAMPTNIYRRKNTISYTYIADYYSDDDLTQKAGDLNSYNDYVYMNSTVSKFLNQSNNTWYYIPTPIQYYIQYYDYKDMQFKTDVTFASNETMQQIKYYQYKLYAVENNSEKLLQESEEFYSIDIEWVFRGLEHGTSISSPKYYIVEVIATDMNGTQFKTRQRFGIYYETERSTKPLETTYNCHEKAINIEAKEPLYVKTTDYSEGEEPSIVEYTTVTKDDIMYAPDVTGLDENHKYYVAINQDNKILNYTNINNEESSQIYFPPICSVLTKFQMSSEFIRSIIESEDPNEEIPVFKFGHSFSSEDRDSTIEAAKTRFNNNYNNNIVFDNLEQRIPHTPLIPTKEDPVPTTIITNRLIRAIGHPYLGNKVVNGTNYYESPIFEQGDPPEPVTPLGQVNNENTVYAYKIKIEGELPYYGVIHNPTAELDGTYYVKLEDIVASTGTGDVDPANPTTIFIPQNTEINHYSDPGCTQDPQSFTDDTLAIYVSEKFSRFSLNDTFRYVKNCRSNEDVDDAIFNSVLHFNSIGIGGLGSRYRDINHYFNVIYQEAIRKPYQTGATPIDIKNIIKTVDADSENSKLNLLYKITDVSDTSPYDENEEIKYDVLLKKFLDEILFIDTNFNSAINNYYVETYTLTMNNVNEYYYDETDHKYKSINQPASLHLYRNNDMLNPLICFKDTHTEDRSRTKVDYLVDHYSMRYNYSGDKYGSNKRLKFALQNNEDSKYRFVDDLEVTGLTGYIYVLKTSTLIFDAGLYEYTSDSGWVRNYSDDYVLITNKSDLPNGIIPSDFTNIQTGVYDSSTGTYYWADGTSNVWVENTETNIEETILNYDKLWLNCQIRINHKAEEGNRVVCEIQYCE